MNINAKEPNLEYTEVEVVNEPTEVQVKTTEQPQVLDAFGITPALKDSLVEYFKNVPLTLGDSESEKIYNMYNALKNATPMKVTITHG
jgi:hypothetical protein